MVIENEQEEYTNLTEIVIRSKSGGEQVPLIFEAYH